MALQRLSGAAADSGFIGRSLNTPMTRREFLGMSAALLLSLLGVQNLISVFVKHTKATSPVPIIASGDGFGSRKFGQ